MRRFFILRTTCLIAIRAHGLLVLSLLQQLELSPQQQNLLLLCRHGVIQGLHRILLKCQLALDFLQIPSQLVNFPGHTLSPACLSAAG